jgi:hypothetical protein
VHTIITAKHSQLMHNMTVDLFNLDLLPSVTQLVCSTTLLLDTLGLIAGMSQDTNILELNELWTPGQEQHNSIKTSTRIFTEDFLTFLTVLTFYNSHFNAHLT